MGLKTVIWLENAEIICKRNINRMSPFPHAYISFYIFLLYYKKGLIFIFSSFPFSLSSSSICLLTQSFPLILLGWWSHKFPIHPPSLPNIIFGILTLPTCSLQFVEYSSVFIEHTSITHDISKRLWILSSQTNWWLEEAYPSIPYHLTILTHYHSTDFSNSFITQRTSVEPNEIGRIYKISALTGIYLNRQLSLYENWSKFVGIPLAQHKNECYKDQSVST